MVSSLIQCWVAQRRSCCVQQRLTVCCSSQLGSIKLREGHMQAVSIDEAEELDLVYLYKLG